MKEEIAAAAAAVAVAEDCLARQVDSSVVEM